MKKNGKEFVNLTGTPTERVNKLRGLGDAVAFVAKPIARGIDAVTKRTAMRTNLANCAGCDRRQEALNRKVPFKT